MVVWWVFRETKGQRVVGLLASGDGSRALDRKQKEPRAQTLAKLL
jgi:hypothetical protein